MDSDTTALAAVLRRLLASIDADEIEATAQQRDYLAGAADSLDPSAAQKTAVSISSY
jgi:hypothetical protein